MAIRSAVSHDVMISLTCHKEVMDSLHVWFTLRYIVAGTGKERADGFEGACVGWLRISVCLLFL